MVFSGRAGGGRRERGIERGLKGGSGSGSWSG